MAPKSLLDKALSDPASFKGEFGAALYSALADRIEGALLSPRRSETEGFLAALVQLFESRLQLAGGDARSALVSVKPKSEMAYTVELSRLSFAVQLLTQSVERRLPEDVHELIASDVYKPYIELMRNGDCTNAELRNKTGQNPETISRKLKVLRDSGLAEFRKHGRIIVNFLTPMALDIIEAIDVPSSRVDVSGCKVLAGITWISDDRDRAQLRGAHAREQAQKRLPPQYQSRGPLIDMSAAERLNGK